MTKRFLRIHGDNIVECERTLKMIAEAYGSYYELQDCPIYFPKYTITIPNCIFVIEFLSGHNRWSGLNLGDIIYNAGGKLRETADSYITEITENKEELLLSIEYCSALPAGNNAWQRNGRALASALANVPYLYYAEIGGIELDKDRKPKAPRYPNPAIPFSYLSLSHDIDSVCLPVYVQHPSMTSENSKYYKPAFGYNDSLNFIRQTINGEDTADTVRSLKEKALRMVEILSNGRKGSDTLCGKNWEKLLRNNNRSTWLINNYKEKWQKKSSEKVRHSDSFKQFTLKIKELPNIPITAKSLPFCIIPKNKIPSLKNIIKDIYKSDINIATNKNLAIVWITGFKPKGDDSRPDRGLSPLCRMILGINANIMAVVSGPGKKEIWEQLKKSPKKLCESNGLFQAVFSFCNYLFVDSIECDKYIFIPTKASLKKNKNNISFPYITSPEIKYSEHDTDCAIHQILSNHKELGINECFCNPPGGDWSGISFFRNDKEYKWTSLPRVSKLSKRPDHIFQIENNGQLIFITVESKGRGKDLERNIGNRLRGYINDLFNDNPTAYRQDKNSEWRYFNGTLGKITYEVVSVGAFLYKDEQELKDLLKKGGLDAIFAFEFGDKTTLHFHANRNGSFIEDYLIQISSEQGGFIVKVH